MNLKIKVNPAFKPIFNDDIRFIIMRGSAGSSKSYSLGQRVIISLLNNQDQKWLVIRKTGKTIRESVFALLRNQISDYNLSKYFIINKTEMSIECIPTGSKVITSGLDDVEKLKSIHGIHKAWIEEASEITEADFKQINLRLRGRGIKHQIYLTFNPIDELHWIKREFFDIPKDNALLHHSTYKDNPFLDAEYKKELEKLKDTDYYYTVYALGEWGTISNAKVFHNAVVIDFDYTAADLENVRHGMDFGFVHASTLMDTGYRDGDLYIFNEQYYKEHTNGQFIGKVDESGFAKNAPITADSAEPDRIQEFKNAGYFITPAKKGKNSLKDGVDYLKNLRTIYIHKTRCPNAAREFHGFKRRELKDGTITEQFVEIDDDTIAGVRYGNEEFWGKGTGRPRIRSI